MPLIETQPDEVAQTYANALFDLAGGAGEGSQSEQILGELMAILDLARADARFGEFLASQAIAASARDASLVAIFEGRASDLTIRFLRLLNKKSRLGHLPAIVEALDHIVQAAFGRVEVDLYTAEPLEDEARESIRTRVAEKLGKQIVLHAYVEPQMLGGIKLKVGDQLIDDSLATQLRRVRDKLVREGGPRIRSRAAQIIDPDAPTADASGNGQA